METHPARREPQWFTLIFFLILAGLFLALFTPAYRSHPSPPGIRVLRDVALHLRMYQNAHEGHCPQTWEELSSSMPPAAIERVNQYVDLEHRYQFLDMTKPPVAAFNGDRILVLARQPGDEGNINGTKGRQTFLLNQSGSVYVRAISEEALERMFAKSGQSLAAHTFPCPRQPNRPLVPQAIIDALFPWGCFIALAVGLILRECWITKNQ